ncbi:hypothetical protein AMJ39_00515 [candidate division TA06 bacterium DG_24]|jgi:large subunit ribosomal protein L10|uniref:Large ribosomal subunit protein uL10 n=2 Tax=Bacteria division TA06 TaxID=1156500 RepID=A0A0S8JIA6_UNCT6|nr:MAG: hypothetical protein AMJ39_00515 [candidate division TA06 bacterium DG_24]KPL08366.1 MAG: hypothetical protein AMJ71_08395 [candidate division TA06 bacterium SM1_40]
MAREVKEARVQELAEKFSSAKAILIADHTGFNVGQMTELRAKLRGVSVEYRVAKNTLSRLAIKQVGFESLLPLIVGPTALVFVKEDPIAPAKVIAEFAEAAQRTAFKGAYLDGEVLTAEEVGRLVDLPPREVLLAQFVSGLAAPLASFAGLFRELLRRFVATLDQIAQQQGAAGDEAAGGGTEENSE